MCVLHNSFSGLLFYRLQIMTLLAWTRIALGGILLPPSAGRQGRHGNGVDSRLQARDFGCVR